MILKLYKQKDVRILKIKFIKTKNNSLSKNKNLLVFIVLTRITFIIHSQIRQIYETTLYKLFFSDLKQSYTYYIYAKSFTLFLFKSIISFYKNALLPFDDKILFPLQFDFF